MISCSAREMRASSAKLAGEAAREEKHPMAAHRRQTTRIEPPASVSFTKACVSSRTLALNSLPRANKAALKRHLPT